MPSVAPLRARELKLTVSVRLRPFRRVAPLRARELKLFMALMSAVGSFVAPLRARELKLVVVGVNLSIGGASRPYGRVS